MIQINEIAHALGHFPPHGFIAEHRLFAFLIEFIDAVGFNFRLVVDAELLFHLDFHRQAVGVPSRLSKHAVPGHGAVLTH